MNAMLMKDTAAKLRDREIAMTMSPVPQFYDFANFLAGRLESQELVPQGFVMAVELAIYDAIKGVNGFTGEKLTDRIVGLPPLVLHLMKSSLFRNLKLILPEDFAADVSSFIDKIGE